MVTFNQSNLQMRSFLIEIEFGSCLPWSFDSPNQVRRLGEISQLTGEDQGSIPHLAEWVKGLALHAIPSFAEAVSSLAARLLSRCKTDWLNLFSDFQCDYTPVLPINSLPGAHQKKREERQARIERRLAREAKSLARGLYWSSVLWFPEPSEKRVLLGDSSITWPIASSKG